MQGALACLCGYVWPVWLLLIAAHWVCPACLCKQHARRDVGLTTRCLEHKLPRTACNVTSRERHLGL